MTDEELIKHLEKRHSAEFKLDIQGEDRSIQRRDLWDEYHSRIHQLDYNGKYADHKHE